MALSSTGLVMIMPRVFYSDPEVTAGWKARWHVSVLVKSFGGTPYFIGSKSTGSRNAPRLT